MARIAAIGGGVIGGGWIARFILHGHDVAVFDPHPEAARILDAVISNATRAYQKMLSAPLGEIGKVIWAGSVAEAVREADYIQESVPERLDLKHRVLAEIEAAARPDALIGSSTSGFRATELREGAKHPGRIFVAHPFNPVYLLPLVEIVGQEGADPLALSQIEKLLTEIGMKPIVLRREIDAHIGDRLLEAVWREALWLVKDGIATTGEIDDVIRFGFGLRWAQMGLFETYRIAGGEAGMRHFLAQFGPALKWPWTKLMDVPDLDEGLVEQISSQSDAQSGQYGIRELEQIRDDNLIGFMQVLRDRNWGAGEVLSAMEARFLAKAHGVSGQGWQVQVRPEWTDYNGHMTEYRYAQVFGDATDAFLVRIGMDAAYRAGGRSVYTVESHLRHLGDLSVGARVTVTTMLLGHDAKRIRLLHEMRDGDGKVVATSEHMLLHVDTALGKASLMEAPLPQRLAEMRPDSPPNFAGRGIRDVVSA
ncbi:carnitine 3-dehydrogenase [Neogemmobacter tilapiae]|uniref:carnitine 3-dehydrogenase n=1 Tax=Neogemmobacter tilapiae TaxID=875041 RepID=UPI00167AACF7|nr:carnitine 3-dehydrogenase [Gemmobacter tilapiae]